jgi:hypothetical protein
MSRKIVTRCEFPPIPIREFDWCAFYEGTEETGPRGYGATEAEAIEDFVINHVDEDEERREREREADARHYGGLSPLGNSLVEAALLDEVKL